MNEGLLDWVLQLESGDLPPIPWKLSPGRTVVNNKGFLSSLKNDINQGPKTPRARFNCLQEDVIFLWNIMQCEIKQ